MNALVIITQKKLQIQSQIKQGFYVFQTHVLKQNGGITQKKDAVTVFLDVKIVMMVSSVIHVYHQIKFKDVNGDNTMTISHNNVLTVA